MFRLYRLLISPLLGSRCRFEPSCSHYAEEALARHGIPRGALLAARRLLRCHPWGGSGIDNVPTAQRSAATSAIEALNANLKG